MTFSYDHSKECEMFNFLRKAKDLDLSSDGSYLPFEDMAITTILKAITFDMTGINCTVTDLRSAAESHIDIIGYKEQNDSIQKA